MEIGDLYIINKSDKIEAESLYNSIKFAIESGETNWRDDWKPSIIKVSALKKYGIDILVQEIARHEKFVKEHDLFIKRIHQRRHKIIELYLKRKLTKYY